MNPVAQDSCAWRVNKACVLILSQCARAVEQLTPGALLVTPYDFEEMAGTIFKAFRMSQVERSGRMKRMRPVVRKENLFWWVDSFLRAGLQIGTRPPRVSKRRLATSAVSEHSKRRGAWITRME